MIISRFPALVLIALLACLPARAQQIQVEEHYFTNDEVADGGKVHTHLVLDMDIIVAGSSIDTHASQPSIVRLDTLGQVVWTTTTLDSAVYGEPMSIRRIMLGSDGYLYASCAENAWLTPQQQIWKVDPSTGAIVWRVPFTAHGAVDHLVDIDSATLVVGHATAYNGFTYSTRLTYLDKANGAIVQIRDIGERAWEHNQYGVVSDGSGHVYYTIMDSLYKIPVTPGPAIWKASYPVTEAGQYGKVHFDGSGIYLLGSRWYSPMARAVRVDPADGSMVWWLAPLQPSGPNVYFADLLDRNGSLYVAWKHAYTGGGTYAWWICRLDKTSGAQQWVNPVYGGSGDRFARSMAMDAMGNLYVTGSHSQGLDASVWRIAKLHGSTGSVIHTTDVTLLPGTDQSSKGVGACIVNGRPYHVGDLRTNGSGYVQQTTPHLVKQDAATGAIIQLTAFGGAYRFPSRTLAMRPTYDGRLVVLKQEGIRLALEKYGPDSTLLWRRVLRHGYAMLGEVMKLDDMGRIIVAAQSRNEAFPAPFYSSTTDSVHVFVFDQAGTLQAHGRFYGNSLPLKVFQVVTNLPASDLFVLYRASSASIRVRRFTGTSFGNESILSVNYPVAQGEGTCARERLGPEFHLFARDGNTLNLYGVNKTTFNISLIGTIQSFGGMVNEVVPVDGDRSLVVGQASIFDMALLYDHALQQAVWFKTYEQQAQLTRAVIGPPGTFAYACGSRTSNPHGVFVRAINMSNGNLVWTYPRSSPGSDFEAWGVAHDADNGLVAFTGYVSDTSNPPVRSAFVEVVDQAGSGHFGQLFDAYAPEAGVGLCMARMPGAELWLGGYMGQGQTSAHGFLFRLVQGTTVGFTPVARVAEGPQAYPNPYSDHVVIDWPGSIGLGADVTIRSMDGRILERPVQRSVAEDGSPRWVMDMSGTSGCFLVQCTLADGTRVGRVICSGQ